MAKGSTIKPALLAAALVVFSLGGFAAANRQSPGPSKTESKLWLTGDSSLHAYASTAHDWQANFGFSNEKPVFEQLKSGQLRSLEVRVPVKEMKSGKNQLDNNMQKALKAEEHPHILFYLDQYEAVLPPDAAQEFTVEVQGTLEIAGVRKKITLEGKVTQEGSALRLQGVADLLMTDYGVKPPRILMIKTSNEITVHYDVWLDEKGRLK